jgi:dihydroneopterin aldolase
MFPSLTNIDGKPFDQVQLSGMLMSCVIGIYPNERSRKQPVTVDLCLYLNTRKAAKSASILDTIDYAGVVQEIAFILDHCEFQLIETAVEAICRHFLWVYQSDHNLPNIDAVMVRISKPSALTHGIIPSVQIMRERHDYNIDTGKALGTRIFKVHDAKDSSLHILVTHGGDGISLRELLPEAEHALPLGRWALNGHPVKNRESITLATSKDIAFSSTSSISDQLQILLVQSRPATHHAQPGS